MACIAFIPTQRQHALSNLTRNDPYPVYTSADPYLFLTREYRTALKEKVTYGDVREWIRFSASMFRQRATVGTDIFGNKDVNLGDLEGRWNMTALLFPAANGNTDVQTALFNALGLMTAPECFQTIKDPTANDVTDFFGFFSVPIKYKKSGARFEAEIALGWDFLLRVQTGVADIHQTVTFIDLTCGATGLSCPVNDCVVGCTPSSVEGEPQPTASGCTPASCCIDTFNCSCKRLVMNHIMKQLCKVADVLKVDIRNFNKIAMEDTRVGLIWRRCFEANFGYCHDWPEFIFMPYVIGEFSAPTGRKSCPSRIFDLPSGNNGHWGYGFTVGGTIDFIETIEVGGEGGMTRFNSRLYCGVPVPTDCAQAGLFPQKADLWIEPGTNWNWSLSMSAFHFLDRLSFWGQYVFVDHQPDCIRVVSTSPSSVPPSNILVGKLREESAWRVHMINTALNYDISPHIALGFMWQAPIKQYNAYKSTTIMGSIVITW